MAAHFDHDLDILRGAAQRYQERTPVREEHRRKLRDGAQVLAHTHERVQLRMQRLTKAAARDDGPVLGCERHPVGPQRAARLPARAADACCERVL